MNYTLSDLRRKEVIDISTGAMLGRVDDIEISTADSTLEAMIVFGRPKLFGLLGRDDDIIINKSQIDLVGRDAVLVKMDGFSNISEMTSFYADKKKTSLK